MYKFLAKSLRYRPEPALLSKGCMRIFEEFYPDTVVNTHTRARRATIGDTALLRSDMQ